MAKSMALRSAMRLGGGGKFAALTKKLSTQKGVRNPAALAASLGRKKYGATKMMGMAIAGKGK